MRLDKLLEFSDAQVITADAISSVMDRNAPDGTVLDDFAVGSQPLYLIMKVTASFNTLTSLDVSFESSAAAALTTARVHIQPKVILLAALLINSIHLIGQLPGGGPLTLRYAGLRYNVIGTNPTLGAVSAWFTETIPANIGSVLS